MTRPRFDLVEEVAKRLGPYEIRGKIGAGGMGVVYLGWDERLNRQVAIKTLWPRLAEDREARERFLREARAAASISHPNVTQIYDIGEEEGRVYFAMEYLEGRSLLDLLEEQGELKPAQVVSIARQAAAGLMAAAERGIIHRDIKPSNLIMTGDGTLKIADFGLAKQQVADSKLTMDGQFVGTPDYIAPEQAQGGALDLRSDIYSLGATLYELAGGRPPFTGPTPVSIVVQHLREPVPELRQVNPEVPLPLATLIQRMLAKRPGARPQDYDELIRQLDRIEAALAEPAAGPARPVTAEPSVKPEPPKANFAGRLFAISLLAIALLVGGAMTLRRGGDEPSAQQHDGLAPLDSEGAAVIPDEVRPPVTIRQLETRPAAGRAELQFVDTVQQYTSDGRLHVTGGVTNLGGGTASGIKVKITLADDGGELIESTEVLVSPGQLEVGDSGSYEAFFSSPPSQVQVRLQVNWLS